MDLSTLGQIAGIVTSAVGTASMIAALTPTPKDDAILSSIRKIVDFLAFNFLNARNAR